MVKFWKSIAIGAVLLMVLVVGYTLVMAQDGDDTEPPAATDPADGEGTTDLPAYGFGRHGGMPHGHGGMDGDWMEIDPDDDWDYRGRMMRGPGLTLDAVAEALGMTTDEVQTELAAGSSIADLAAAHNVEIQTVIDALMAEHQAWLDAAVEDGRLTQEQVDALQADTLEHITDMVNTAGLGGHHHGMAPGAIPDGAWTMPRGGFGVMNFSWLDTLAELLGMTADEVQTELAAGSSIADLAEANNVDLQVIIDALMAEHQATLDAAVADGRLTQEQADAMQANALERITDMVNNSWNAGPCGSGGMMFGGRGGHGGRGGGMGRFDNAVPQGGYSDTGLSL